MKFGPDGELISMSLLGEYIPSVIPIEIDPTNSSNILKYGPVQIDFAPCVLGSDGLPVTEDPVGRLMEYYKAQHQTIQSTWSLTCHATEQDMYDTIAAEYKPNRLGAYSVTSNDTDAYIAESHFSSPVDTLLDPSKGIDYTFMNHQLSGLNYEGIFGELLPEDEDPDTFVYKGPQGKIHAQDVQSIQFLQSISLTLQYLFEDTVIKFKGENFPEATPVGDVPYNMHVSELSVYKSATPRYSTYHGMDDNFRMFIPLFLVMLVSNTVGRGGQFE